MAFEKSALLELLNSRKCWDCGKDERGQPKPCPPYKEPSNVDERANEHAAFMAARADDSDPFVYRRMRHYARRGYVLISDTLKSARSRLSLRANEASSGMKGLDRLKRELDEDWAWNQHNSQEYIKDKEK
jgi:hypothetical protein